MKLYKLIIAGIIILIIAILLVAFVSSKSEILVEENDSLTTDVSKIDFRTMTEEDVNNIIYSEYSNWVPLCEFSDINEKPYKLMSGYVDNYVIHREKYRYEWDEILEILIDGFGETVKEIITQEEYDNNFFGVLYNIGDNQYAREVGEGNYEEDDYFQYIFNDYRVIDNQKIEIDIKPYKIKFEDSKGRSFPEFVAFDDAKYTIYTDFAGNEIERLLSENELSSEELEDKLSDIYTYTIVLNDDSTDYYLKSCVRKKNENQIAKGDKINFKTWSEEDVDNVIKEAYWDFVPLCEFSSIDEISYRMYSGYVDENLVYNEKNEYSWNDILLTLIDGFGDEVTNVVTQKEFNENTGLVFFDENKKIYIIGGTDANINTNYYLEEYRIVDDKTLEIDIKPYKWSYQDTNGEKYYSESMFDVGADEAGEYIFYDVYTDWLDHEIGRVKRTLIVKKGESEEGYGYGYTSFDWEMEKDANGNEITVEAFKDKLTDDDVYTYTIVLNDDSTDYYLKSCVKKIK